MFGGFFNRMYYGDPRKPDLKKEDMPENPFKLFFTVIQIRFWKLIQLNLLYSIFWIPTFLLSYLQLTLMAETQQSPSILYFLLLIPCLLFAGPATAGVTYVLRNWARDEHAWVWSDFKDAWRENWKSSLLVMLFNGVMIMVLFINITFYQALARESFLFLVLEYVMLLLTIIFALMNVYIFPMLVTYKLTFRQVLKNAFIFAVVKLPHTLAVVVLAVVLFYFSVLYTIPVFLVGLTFPALITISMANWVFDKYLNRRTAVNPS